MDPTRPDADPSPLDGSTTAALDRGALVNLLGRVRQHLAHHEDSSRRLTVVQHRLILQRLAEAGMIAPQADCPRTEQLEAVVEMVSDVVGIEPATVRGCL